MKSPAIRKLRQKLAADEPVYGLWVTLESASITEMGVALGLDWVVVDAEHGHLDWRDILEHIRATVRSDTVVLVRVAELNIGLIKRALDIGADGVVVPWMEEVEQLRDAVAFAHYPPAGLRGIGAERATCWGQCFVEHVEEADEHVLVVPIIESVRGGQNIDQLLAVDGVELFFFGPADYSSTAGYPGQWEGPGVAAMIEQAKDAIRAAGKNCGVVATSNENLDQRRDQGFRMIGLGLDGGLLLRSLRGALDHVGRDRTLGPSLGPEGGAGRSEVVVPRGSGSKIEIGAGVVFEGLPHGRTQHLTTGFTTFAPGAQLPYHRQAHAESLTLVSGEAIVEVEGRMYALERYDNLTVPAGLARAALNASTGQPAVFHVALPTAKPEQTPVEQFFSRRRMPDDTIGHDGAEHLTRHRSAASYTAGADTTCIDFFNGELVPGVEMSGGWARFAPGGRQPAHAYDCDAVVAVVEGAARCVVEGRHHALDAGAMLLQPRGQVLSIANEADEPLVAIWVCASPMPGRRVVA
jgi:2-keto-3-deoxy-L-rhamnonate aldolase RhmA/quercetin dioxygenase-like cupin family protein